MSTFRRFGLIASAFSILLLAILVTYFLTNVDRDRRDGKPRFEAATGGYETIFSGTVVSRSGKPAPSAKVDVNGAATIADNDRKFTLTVPATASPGAARPFNITATAEGRLVGGVFALVRVT